MTAAERPDLTALVADDEALARRRITDLLRQRGGVRVIRQCESGTATLEAVRELAPDLLFLDVQMPGLDGFEVLARLTPEQTPLVIFSTAYDEYALAAFEVHAVDYLLKPFDDERFAAAVERAERALRDRRVHELHERLRALLATWHEPQPASAGAAAGAHLERFAVPVGHRLEIIDAAAVDWIEAARDYVKLHVGEASHLVRATMNTLEQRLDPGRFMRIHRSRIVRLDRVRRLQTDAFGEWVAVLDGGERLRVGRRYRDALLDRLGRRPGGP